MDCTITVAARSCCQPLRIVRLARCTCAAGTAETSARASDQLSSERRCECMVNTPFLINCPLAIHAMNAVLQVCDIGWAVHAPRDRCDLSDIPSAERRDQAASCTTPAIALVVLNLSCSMSRFGKPVHATVGIHPHKPARKRFALGARSWAKFRSLPTARQGTPHLTKSSEAQAARLLYKVRATGLAGERGVNGGLKGGSGSP